MTAPLFGSKPSRPTLGIAATDPPSGQGRTNTWLTPKRFIDLLGPFDLDPCAAPTPRVFSTAARHITPPGDGLSESWEGEVWLNPPYSRSIFEWTDRMIEHGRGIALVFVRSDTTWWQRAADQADSILFMLGRIRFLDLAGVAPKSTAATPSCLMAFGSTAASRLQVAHARAALPGILINKPARGLHMHEPPATDSIVKCRKCLSVRAVVFAHCLANGWPKCHEATMELVQHPSAEEIEKATGKALNAQGLAGVRNA